jgi:hypothetical protein
MFMVLLEDRRNITSYIVSEFSGEKS